MLRSIKLDIPGEPVSKPRQTRSDKWKKRPCVIKYREWADRARSELNKVNIEKGYTPIHLSATAFFSIPKYLEKKVFPGYYHRKKPDSDNCLKATLDALFPKNDSMVASVQFIKKYSKFPMVCVEIIYSNKS